VQAAEESEVDPLLAAIAPPLFSDREIKALRTSQPSLAGDPDGNMIAIVQWLAGATGVRTSSQNS
jgi:hypothetical protein